MQTSPYDTGYPHHLQHHHGGGVYGSVPGFDSSGLKFHHGGYPDAATDAAAFYQNYVNSGVAATQDYAPREPPSYAESTTPATSSSLFHPGFVHTSSTDYYKVGVGGGGVGVGVGGGGSVAVSVNDASLRQMDMVSDYHGVVRTPGMADNFLMKSEVVGGGNGCSDAVGGAGHLLDYNARYSNENLHQLHHQQRQHQRHHHLQHPHQQAQHQKPQMQMPAELGPEECKIEPETPQEYKPTSDLNVAPAASLSNLQHHQQPQQATDDHPDLPQAPVSDATEPPCQSPGSDDTSGEGTEVTSGSRETDANSAATEAAPGSQQDGNGGDEQAKNSNEVKPTLSYIALIAKSILESPQRRLNLGSIYGWIEKNFPYYKNRGQGWRNSVRHNLSLNDCFIKAGRCEDGKGNYWAIHPANMQDFLRGDFRQRRRSRRRGRKKDCELGMYHHHQLANGYLGASAGVAAAAAAAAGSSLGMGGFPPSAATLSNIYSPYTDAERRAYRLDEALLRQSMNNPFLKWYHQPSAYPPATSPSAVNAGVYGGVGGVTGVGGVGGSTSQWPQTYPDNNGQGVYPLNSSFSR